MKKVMSQEKQAETLNHSAKDGAVIDCRQLHSLMDAVIEKAREVQSECGKERPEIWKLCDLAVDDLESILDKVHMCVFARCMREAEFDRRTVPEPDIARFYKSVDTLSVQ